MSDEILADLKKRMNGAVENLKKELAGLRTGRASTSLVETVMVEAYGSSMPLTQVGTVTVPEPRMLSVQVWDKTMVSAVEKGIQNAGLGLNPVTDGQSVRIPLPDLSEERRKELVKVAGRYAEQNKVSARNVRRDGMESLKKAEKNGDMSKDEMHTYSDKIQTLTDDIIKQIDSHLAEKEKEILQV
ncbi:MAG: ribosome recycling factor [Alphaproteobacteria bacterium]